MRRSIRLTFMSKYEQIDFFPWILGGLVIAITIPVVMALSRSANEPIRDPRLTMAAPSSVGAVATYVRPALLPTTVAAVPSQPPTRIWQCASNGQKTFSDSPCGADASVQQLSEINRMDVAPVSHLSTYPAYSSVNYDPAPTDQYMADGYVGSSSSQLIVISERERREHIHKAHEREHRIGLAHN
jgi:hypothetical protein